MHVPFLRLLLIHILSVVVEEQYPKTLWNPASRSLARFRFPFPAFPPKRLLLEWINVWRADLHE